MFLPFPALTVEEELEEVVVVEELQEEEVVVQVEEVLEEVVDAGMSPSMSAALWECDRQRALIGSKPSYRQGNTGLMLDMFVFLKMRTLC